MAQATSHKPKTLYPWIHWNFAVRIIQVVTLLATLMDSITTYIAKNQGYTELSFLLNIGFQHIGLLPVIIIKTIFSFFLIGLLSNEALVKNSFHYHFLHYPKLDSLERKLLRWYPKVSFVFLVFVCLITLLVVGSNIRILIN